MIKELKSLISLLHRQVKRCEVFLLPDAFRLVFSCGLSLFVTKKKKKISINNSSSGSDLSVYLHPYRCWELRHHGWMWQPPPYPHSSPISSMSCSPAMSSFNTSSSSVTGRIERFSASSPRSPRCNDNPSTIIIFQLLGCTNTEERVTWTCGVPPLVQREYEPHQCATAVTSIP